MKPATEGAILDDATTALRIRVTGRVQGVGFRPFVFRLAQQHSISGQVRNLSGDVEILACGSEANLSRFLDDLVERAPPLARPEVSDTEPQAMPSEAGNAAGFRILDSASGTDARIFVPPDYFMCDDCREELNDPANRRYRYPFINCTQCGPRYTLITAMPYDRPNTSMAGFPLCPDCEKEYSDPTNRRFHAEPVACPRCGPSIVYREPGGTDIDDADAAMAAVVDALREGCIVTVKGVGGYHLVCDATNDAAVARLRARKRRPAKPFAVMFPLAGEDGLGRVQDAVRFERTERDALTGPERPIVLAEKRAGSELSAGVAPGLAELGVFLPYSPLHALLLDAFDGPLVATSGNISGEPVLTENAEADERLTEIVDAFLHHDRPIVRPADDPVLRRISGRLRPIRLGRGTAPTELAFPGCRSGVTLAVGAHMKGTVTLAWDGRAVVSPHIGEMDSVRSLAVFESVVADLQSLYGVSADRIVCDAHPGYTTHRWARQQDLPVETVWHHAAHASALAGEHPGKSDWLVFTWDGVGLGEDGTLWGGEAFTGRPGDWQRAASLRSFRLVGGERAGREPWRSAAGLLWACGLNWPEAPDPEGLALNAWRHRLNAPETTAAGRLFDAAAALILGGYYASFEAEGPMQLEALCREREDPQPLELERDDHGIWRADWQPLLAPMMDTHLEPARRAALFHASMARLVLDQALAVREEREIAQVGLCGGVFQNRVLTEQASALLKQHGFDVYLAGRLPANDAAISFGQAVESNASATQDD